jgi:hypothetical protein
VKDSGLEAMFSGRWDIEYRDGNPFIDRNPEIFILVIHFLKNGLKDL